MKKKDIRCACGEPITPRGKATASRCIWCYNRERTARKLSSRETGHARYQRLNAKAGKVCADCATSISRHAIRCRPCQNRRPESNAVRVDHIRETRWAKNYEISRRGYHKRARAVAGPPQPCRACGGDYAELHHIDRNYANNRPENLVWLCDKCHMGEHARQRHLGRGRKAS